MRFRVIIDYREPTYALRAGTHEAPFQALFTVDAPTAEAAKTQAVSEFETDGRISGVRWVRSIVSVSAAAADPVPLEAAMATGMNKHRARRVQDKTPGEDEE